MNQNNEKQLWVAIVTVIVIIIVLMVVWILPTHKAKMAVRTLEWQYRIDELEDYLVYQCYPRSRTIQTCSGFGSNRSCTNRIERYQDCRWETRTRRHNTWVTGGQYPIVPFWETNYSIATGHYERRNESYTVTFSDDKELYPYHPGSLNEYNKFAPRQKFTVNLNLFEHITGVD